MYFAQRFLSLEFSTCFLSFITLAASSSLPFFPCISSHFPCSCPLPSHDFLLMCLSSLYPPSPHSYIHLCRWGSCSVLIWWVEMSTLWGGQRWEQPDSLWSCWAALASETDWRADYNGVAKGLSWLCHKWLNTRLPASQDLLTSFVSLSFFFFFTELPPGWEKIDDPVYGVYYVE